MKQIFNYLKRNSWLTPCILILLGLLIGDASVLMADVTIATPGSPTATPGQAGLSTQVEGATTVSSVTEAGGDLMQPEIDSEIVQIDTDQNVLDTIKRSAKRQVQVDSFEVDHYMIDEKRISAKTTAAVTEAKTTQQFPITMSDDDAKLFYEYTTAIVKGVKGYAADGSTKTDAFLMLYCVGKNDSNMPKFICINGPKSASTQSAAGTPAIPSGSEIVLLGSAGYETQERIAPNTVLPVSSRVYLQKQLCNSIVSDYFESNKKRIPFHEAQIAEAVVRQFRLENCRTAWVGIKGKFKVQAQDKNMGDQFVYTTEGVRWQIKRSYELAEGKITLADIVNLAKFKFTGYNCSKNAIWVMGRDLLADIQKIDMTLHKDISMAESEVFGIKCTKLKTVFGTIDLVHDPVLDRIGYEKCGALLDLDGLVRYWRKNESSKSEKVEGEEAKRDIVMCIDALCLKGYSHVWVDGSNVSDEVSPSMLKITPVATLPSNPVKGQVIILTADQVAPNATMKDGDILEYSGTAWVAYTGVLLGQA